MKIEEIINNDLKKAMLARDTAKKEALRGVKKVIIESKTSKGGSGDISDEEIVKIIQKLVKQGKESAELFKSQDRDDLYEFEMLQVQAMEIYLPEQLSEEQVTEKVKEIIAKVGATSMKEMGKVMGVATKELAGIADGKLVSQKVRELLG